LYLCGHPGTGKTATLNHFFTQFAKNNKFKLYQYNAMTFSTPLAFLTQFAYDLKIKNLKKTGKPVDTLQEIHQKLKSIKKFKYLHV
jgi:Cdc6-like AAA superfamily ATPase